MSYPRVYSPANIATKSPPAYLTREARIVRLPNHPLPIPEIVRVVFHVFHLLASHKARCIRPMCFTRPFAVRSLYPHPATWQANLLCGASRSTRMRSRAYCRSRSVLTPIFLRRGVFSSLPSEDRIILRQAQGALNAGEIFGRVRSVILRRIQAISKPTSYSSPARFSGAALFYAPSLLRAF